MEAVTAAPTRPDSSRLEHSEPAAHRWLRRKWAFWAYVFINAVLLTGLLLAPQPTSSVFWAVIPAFAVVALAVGVRHFRPRTSIAWWLITAGLAAGATAPVIDAVSWLTEGRPPPGWVGPLVALVALPPLISGLALLGRYGGRRDTADMLDAAVVALAVFLVLFALVIHPTVPQVGEAVAAGVIFPLGALLLFAMAVWLVLSVGVPTTSTGLLLLAVGAGLGGTVSLLVPGLGAGIVEGGPLTWTLFSAFFILIGAAGLHPSLGYSRRPQPHRHDPVSRRRIGLLALLAVVAPVVWGGEIISATGVGAVSVTVPLIVSAALLLVVVARLGLTAGLAQNRAAELTERSEQLARAAREQEILQRQLRYQAMHDPLTGLANRVALSERMEWAFSRPDGARHALAIIDLDQFKDVNDAFGHATGDQLLVEASHRLLATIPPGGTLARFGGDEFAALLENTPPSRAAAWCETARQSLRQSYRIAGHDLYLSASIGLVTTEPDRPTPIPSETLRDADLALFSAKASGRDRIEMFRTELRTARTDYRWLRTGLQRALANDELMLDYQPVVDLATGRITAVEALLRWAPSGGPPLPPSTFISVAEDAALIGPIGAWVLHRACRDAKPWYDGQGVSVTVNVSARQLDDPSFGDTVMDALRTSDLSPSALILEITETSLVATSAASRPMDQLHRLRGHGVRVAIDDFGTGYSSLANVARLPVDIIKIDSAFVQNPELPETGGSEGWAFTRAILSMVEALRLQAVAEGVETLEQAEALRRLRCPLAQGFLFARPMPASVLSEALAESQVLTGALVNHGRRPPEPTPPR
jgi:diguanylate cyclase